MKKKFVLAFLSFVLIFPFMLMGCNKNKNTDNNNNTVSSAAKVMEVVSEKLVEVTKTMAQSASGNVTSDTTTKSNAVNKTINAGSNLGQGWQKSTVGEYLSANALAARIIYSIDFITRNATKENGYSNGFEYGKIYTGEMSVDSMDGILRFTLNNEANGVSGNFDFIADYDENLVITYRVNIFFGYDFATDTAKNIKLNYVILPLAHELFSVEIDFDNNNFTSMYFWGGQENTLQQGSEIISSFNSGFLNFNTIMSYNYHGGTIVSGNISNNINNISYTAYEYSNWNDDISVSATILGNIYNSIYGKLNKFKLRTATDNMSEVDNIVVNYANEAFTYGTNKSDISIYTDNNKREYYLYTFLEYDEMVSYLTTVKNTINNDNSASQSLKDIANAALNYVTNRGKTKYTGGLGTYDGITCKFDYDTMSDYTNDVYVPYAVYRIVSGKTMITFNVKNDVFTDLYYDSVTYKNVYTAVSAYLNNGWASEDVKTELNELINSIGSYRAESNEIFDLYNYNVTQEYDRFIIEKKDSSSNYEIALYLYKTGPTISIWY